MLSPDQIRSLLQQHLNAEIVTFEFTQKTYPMKTDTQPDASWRDHHLRTFSVRLRSAIEHKASPDLIAELKSFVSSLERLDRTADLYSWQARTAAGYYYGWATENKVIYTTKTE